MTGMATPSPTRTPMPAVPDWPYGPYTVEDLDALPDEGVRRELANGWIIVAPWPSTFHDHAAKVLERALEDAAAEAGADVYVKGPLDIDTGPSIRVPDIAVVKGEAARAARARRARAYDASDVVLVVDIVSPRNCSEQQDRVGKMFEYARAGIPQYWLVDLEPAPTITIRRLGGDSRYHVTASIGSAMSVKIEEPFPFVFEAARLIS